MAALRNMVGKIDPYRQSPNMPSGRLATGGIEIYSTHLQVMECDLTQGIFASDEE